MSRRTAESNKAILAAWNKEQELVLEGKGTREWTLQQQQDILNKGKAYDDDGVAFQGQHMKSAEKYPECQGDPGNIQFLTRTEHLEAHNGNWRNPTNWYFNPVTKEKINFGDGKYIPCEIIQLSEPVIKSNSTIEDEETEVIETVNKNVAKKVEPNPTDSEYKKEPICESGGSSNTTRSLRGIVKSVVDFSNQHPILTTVVKGVGGTIGLVAMGKAISNVGDFGSESSYDSDDYNISANENNLLENIFESSFSDDTLDNMNYNERSLPREHMVKSHEQNYHTKDGVIRKTKDPYPRGGNKNE